MAYEYFRHARRVDADNLGIYHNDMSKMLNIDKGTINTTILTGLDAASKILRIKGCGGNAYPYIEITGGGDISLITGHEVTIASGAKHALNASGVHFFAETTTPTAKASYGAIYTKADNKLYFQDGAGVEYTVTIV